MTRSPRPSEGPRWTNRTWSSRVLDDAGEFGAAADQVAGSELAFEDGVLEMVAETAHEFEDFAEAAVVGDVVTDEIGLAHNGLPAASGTMARPVTSHVQKDSQRTADLDESTQS